MEGSITCENENFSRIECDRVLRSYRAMNDVLLSSRSYGKSFGEEDKFDEASMRAQMFAIRSAILEVEDSRERLFLYHYYTDCISVTESLNKLVGNVSDLKAREYEYVCMASDF